LFRVTWAEPLCEEPDNRRGDETQVARVTGIPKVGELMEKEAGFAGFGLFCGVKRSHYH
jgi:hypothetical protein